MNKESFSKIRHRMGKTQKELAQLLGISLKAIQSFEQGWRKIPAHVERQALFLLTLRSGTRARISPCWKIRKCPSRTKKICPAWEFKVGHLCWFINGTICQGKPQKSWAQKMLLCKKCQVFASFTKRWGFPSWNRSGLSKINMHIDGLN